MRSARDGVTAGTTTRRRRSTAALWAVGLAAVSGITLGGTHASASQPVPGHTQLVTDQVRTNTPRVTTGEISDIEVIGTKVYVAGSFTSVANSNGTTYAQPYLFAWNMDTGLVDTTFRPAISSAVDAVEASPDGTALYIGGAFNTINGVTKRKLARISPTTGAPVTTFTANANARVYAIAVSNNWVYAGGQFTTMNSVSRSMLAAVNPTTGATDTAFNLPVTEGIGGGGVLKVEQLKLTTDDAKLLVVHTGRNVAGQQRVAAAVINTAAKTLNPWNTNLYANYLPVVGGVMRVTNGDISPDNSFIVLTSGGGGDRPPVNDTAVAFSLNPPVNQQSDVPYLWVSRHFDSLYGVEITEKAVYIGGHFRYQEAPTATQPWPGSETANYGWGESQGAGVLGPNEVVRRDMLGALDPATGTALQWNPGAEALLGHSHLEATPRGLFVGMDAAVLGGQSIGRLGFFDWNNIPPPAAAETYVDYPFEGALAAGGAPIVFEGRATATAGVGSVQILIQNRDSKQYLQDDGVTWSTTYNTINATLGAGTTSRTWTYTSGIFPGGNFKIDARTTASNGTRDATWASKKFVSQVFDNPAPVSTVTFPTFGSGALTTPTFIVTGRSTDDTGVNNVRLQIRNTDTNQYLQNDGTFDPGVSTLAADLVNPGSQTVDWSLEITVPPGTYNITAVATDTEGLTEHEGLGTRFSVVSSTNTPPAVTLTAPAATSVTVPINSIVNVAGTATDDTNVVKVEVSVRNNSTGYGIQIDGTYGPVPSYFQVTPVNTSSPSVNFSYNTPALPAGTYTIRVRGTDDTDVRTPTTATPPSTIAQPNYTVISGVAGDALPDTLLTFASSTQDIDTLNLPITGTATDATGVTSVKIQAFNNTTKQYLTGLGGGLSFTNTMFDVPVTPAGGTSVTFSTTLPLGVAGNWKITAVAVDTVGQLDGSSTGATATYLIFPGDANPSLQLDLQTPINNGTYAKYIPVGGRATDDISVARVNVTVKSNATNQYLTASGTWSATSVNLTAYLTNPGGPGSNFNYNTPTLTPGAYTVTVTPVDGNGQVMSPAYSAIANVTA